MAKLSEEILELGRDKVRARDMTGLLLWIKKHAPLTNLKVVRETYEKVFRYNDIEKGLKLFDAVFPESDTAKDIRHALIKLVFILLVFVGALGGTVYLFRSCTGM